MGISPEESSGKTDVLIIGQGIAGLSSAIEARRSGVDVTVVSYSESSSESNFPISRTRGIQYAGNKIEIQQLSTTVAGISEVPLKGELVSIMLKNSREAVDFLKECGVGFLNDPDGNPRRTVGCFGNRETAAIISDVSEIHKLKSLARKMGVKFITGYLCKGLICEKSSYDCCGAWFVGELGSLKVNAGATVVAAGGYSGIYNTRLTTGNAIGTHLYLLKDFGDYEPVKESIINLEFIQIMVAILAKRGLDFLSIHDLDHKSILKAPSGRILNTSNWEKVCESRRTHFPFSYSFISREFDLQIARNSKGSPCILEKKGEMFHVKHAVHVSNGGICIRPDASVPGFEGLYAAGESTTGMHGANRLGGAMFTSSVVFGRISGISAALFAKKRGKIPDLRPDMTLEVRDSGLQGGEIRNYINMVRNLMDSKAMAIRSGNELRRAIKILEDVVFLVISDRGCANSLFLRDFCRLETISHSAHRVLNAMMARGEPCGSHYIET